MPRIVFQTEPRVIVLESGEGGARDTLRAAPSASLSTELVALQRYGGLCCT